MNKSEYDIKILQWATNAKTQMASILQSKTHASGYLQKHLEEHIYEEEHGGRKIAFAFPRYGVFVHYGVGRGWVRHGGSVVRGSRVKKNTDLWHQLRKRGYTTKEMTSTVMASNKVRGRHPLNWLDKVIMARINNLADMAAEYAGDYARDELLKNFRKMKINKKKK